MAANTKQIKAYCGECSYWADGKCCKFQRECDPKGQATLKLLAKDHSVSPAILEELKTE